MCSFDDAIGVLVEHDEKIAFGRQQFPKKHGVSCEMNDL
jgi:hypothetical protein